MRLKDFLKVFYILLLIFIVTAYFVPQQAHAQIPFGGMITFLFPACFEGFWIILGPPTAGSYMYSYGSYSYAYGPPSHPGQWLLGKAAGFLTCTVQCGPSPCVIGGGLLILFHGSSV